MLNSSTAQQLNSSDKHVFELILFLQPVFGFT